MCPLLFFSVVYFCVFNDKAHFTAHDFGLVVAPPYGVIHLGDCFAVGRGVHLEKGDFCASSSWNVSVF